MEDGCLNPLEMVEVGSGGGSDVASETRADGSQGGSCTTGYVARTTRHIGAGEGLNVDCVGSAEVSSGGGSDVASKASTDDSQGGSCTRGYVTRNTRRVGAGEGLDVDCVGPVGVGSKEPRVASNSAGRIYCFEIARRNGGGSAVPWKADFIWQRSRQVPYRERNHNCTPVARFPSSL